MVAGLVALLSVGCGGALSQVRPPPGPVVESSPAGVPSRARYQYLVGRLAREQGDWVAAESGFKTALLHDPDSPWLWLALADVSAGAGESAEELARVEQAVQSGPSNPVAWTRLGEIKLREGDVRGGLDALREAIDAGAGSAAYAPLCRVLVQRADPLAASTVRAWSALPLDSVPSDSAWSRTAPSDLGGLLRERGRLRLQVGDLAGATDDLGEALVRDPGDARLLDAFLTAVTGSGLYRQGLARLVTVHRLAPHDTDVLLRTYHLAAQAHDEVRAIDALEALDRALAGREAQVKVWLADAYSALGRHADARAAIESAGACQPPLADVGYHRARIARAAGKYADALKALRIPEVGVNRPDALALRVRVQLELGQVQEARAGVEQALRDLPEDYVILGALIAVRAAEGNREAMLAAVDRMAMLDDEARGRTRARSLAGIGDLDGAIVALHGAGLQQPDSWVVGGGLLRDAGRAADAVSWLERAVDRFPRHPQLRAELGLALAAAGTPDRALIAMREALRMDPAEPRAARYLVNSLDFEGSPERIRQVRSWVLAALERAPADAGLLAALGRVEEALGDPLRAVEAWEEALRYGPADPLLLSRLATAYRAVGRAHQAAALEAGARP